MATTTNYGWTTPDDTALVKDGAAAIRTLGSSVDTTTKALNPSTTLGDIEYRSSTANTNTRLGIGSTGQVLTVSGGVPSWATAGGDYVKLSSASFSAVSSVTLNDVFSATYNNYRLFITISTGSGSALRARWRVSGSDASGSDYEWTRLYTSGATVGAAGGSSQSSADISDLGGEIAADITIYRPFLTSATLVTAYNLYNAPAGGTDHGFYVSAHNQAVSYTGMTFFPSSSTITGNYSLYGLRA
jgi:hypothetical protein